MISNWALYYMMQSDYAQYKMNIYHMYQDVLKIAKREENPKEWHKYRELLEEIQEMEDKCTKLKEDMAAFKNRI